jgi:predicted DNA-binding protein (MmcQ/YjbR family)
MTEDEFNRFCAALPATSHVVQWGGAQVWKVGGKVFAIGGWRKDGPAFTFKTSDIAFEVLNDQPGLRPAPYLASRGLKWIQHYREPGLSDSDLQAHIQESHRMIAAALSKKKQRELGLL